MLAGGADYAQSHAARADDPKYHKRTWMKANPSLGHMPDLESAIAREAGHARRDPSLLASFEALRLKPGNVRRGSVGPPGTVYVGWDRGRSRPRRALHVGDRPWHVLGTVGRRLHSGRRLAGWKPWRRSLLIPASRSGAFATEWGTSTISAHDVAS